MQYATVKVLYASLKKAFYIDFKMLEFKFVYIEYKLLTETPPQNYRRIDKNILGYNLYVSNLTTFYAVACIIKYDDKNLEMPNLVIF